MLRSGVCVQNSVGLWETRVRAADDLKRSLELSELGSEFLVIHV